MYAGGRNGVRAEVHALPKPQPRADKRYAGLLSAPPPACFFYLKCLAFHPGVGTGILIVAELAAAAW